MKRVVGTENVNTGPCRLRTTRRPSIDISRGPCVGDDRPEIRRCVEISLLQGSQDRHAIRPPSMVYRPT